MSDYPKTDWSIFASTLLENAPHTLFGPAETEACKTSPQALEDFHECDSFTEWCELNLHFATHSTQAAIAVSNLKQISTFSVYRSAFNTFASHAGNCWWFQGLRSIIATGPALDPLTLLNILTFLTLLLQLRTPGCEGAASPLQFGYANRTFSTAQEGEVCSPDTTIIADPSCGCQQADQGLCPSTQHKALILADWNPAT